MTRLAPNSRRASRALAMPLFRTSLAGATQKAFWKRSSRVSSLVRTSRKPSQRSWPGLLAADVHEREDEQMLLGRDRPIPDKGRYPPPQTGDGNVRGHGKDHGSGTARSR